jgi:hypothetical protein
MGRIRPALLLLGLAALAPLAAGQGLVILSEDFEDGLEGWTVVSSPLHSVPWHAAAPGECLAVNSMAACNNGPSACTYVTDATSTSWLRLQSPSFTLAGAGPWTIAFDYIAGIDTPDSASLWLLANGGDGIFSAVSLDLPNSTGLQHVEVVKTFTAFWPGKSVQLELELQSDVIGNGGFGFLVDNIVVTAAGTWIEQGTAKLGSNGVPYLTGTGTLAPHSANQLTLIKAAPSSLATVVFGLQTLHQPYKGGYLYPAPLVLLPAPTDAFGEAHFPFILPAGLPPDLPLHFQCWIQDPGASFGLSASNGVAGVTG